MTTWNDVCEIFNVSVDVDRIFVDDFCRKVTESEAMFAVEMAGNMLQIRELADRENSGIVQLSFPVGMEELESTVGLMAFDVMSA